MIDLKHYYIVFVLLKKNEKGLRGKQQFEPFTQSQDIFSHFSTFYVKAFASFKLILYISYRKDEKQDLKVLKPQ